MWGVAYAIGMGTVKPVLEPTLLQSFLLDDTEKTHRRKWQRAQQMRQRRKRARDAQAAVMKNQRNPSSNTNNNNNNSTAMDDQVNNDDEEEEEDDEEEEEGIGRRDDAAYANVPTNAPLGTDMGLFGSIPCIDVACGGGFTVVVTRYEPTHPSPPFCPSLCTPPYPPSVPLPPPSYPSPILMRQGHPIIPLPLPLPPG